MTERKKMLDRLYDIGVGIKGIDGLAELIAGVMLAFTPGVFHNFLVWITGNIYHHSGFVYEFSADYIARLDHDLARIGMTFVVVYLIGHGIIKIILALLSFETNCMDLPARNNSAMAIIYVSS